MANSSKKVKFHPLERLDLVDVDNLQDLAHNVADDFIGGITGVSGMLDTPSSWNVDNTTELITPTDFTFLGQKVSESGVNSTSSFFGHYIASDTRNGDISFDAVRSQVQAYYNANGALPRTPLDTAVYDPAVHGFAFPYLYALTYTVDSTSEPRRFWSTENANETTQNVNTTVEQYHTFSFVPREDSAPLGGDFPATRIARIGAWTVTAEGVVELYTIFPVLVADNILDLYPYHIESNPLVALSAGGKRGIPAAINWLKQRQDSMMDGGVSDPATTTAVGGNHIARYSLAGLEKLFDDRVTELEQKVLRATAVIKSRVNVPEGINEITAHSPSTNDFIINVFRDYGFLLDATLTNGVEFSPGVTVSDLSAINDVERMAGAIAVTIPEQYLGYTMMVNLTTIFPAHDYGWLYNGDKDGGGMVNANSKRSYDESWIINPGYGHTEAALGSASVWANYMNTVQHHRSVNNQGEAYGTLGICGFPIAHPMAFNNETATDITNQALVDSDAIVTLYVKVDITLVKDN